MTPRGKYCIVKTGSEETLIAKNEIRVNKRGSEPIEKNISVIDETGKKYEATYPKRAKGLVKKGRARFVDENTVCLACPPNILEDTKMSDNNIKTQVDETAEPNEVAAEAVEKIEEIEKIDETTGKKSSSEPELTVGYILSQIEKIQQDNEHIFKALTDLENLVINDGVGDIANQAKCEAVRDVAVHREATNQKLIDFYMKLYDDIDPNRHSLIDLITAIERCDAGMMSSETSAAVKAMLFDRIGARDGYKLKFEALADLVTAHNEPSISDLRSLAQSLRKG